MNRIKKFLSLVFKQVCRHPVTNIILLIQTVLVLHIGFNSYFYYSDLLKSEAFVDNMAGKNIYYIAPRADYGVLNDAITEANDMILEKINNGGEKNIYRKIFSFI